MSNPNIPRGTVKMAGGMYAGIHYPQLTALVPCPGCGHEMDSSLIVTLRNPTTGDIVFRGCWACMERRLAPHTGIDYATRMLLQRAYNALTMPSTYADDAEVATEIQRVLQGS